MRESNKDSIFESDPGYSRVFSISIKVSFVRPPFLLTSNLATIFAKFAAEFLTAAAAF